VAVIEGTVKVRPDESYGRSAGVTINHGQAATLDLVEKRMIVSRADLNRIQNWQFQRLEFDNVPIDHAVAEFNRYSGKPVVVEDRALSALKISGVFRIGDTAAFVKSLSGSLSLRAIDKDDRIVLERKGKRKTKSQ
jgi:transmembrane sensor